MSYVAKKIQDMPYSGIRKFFDLANEIKDIISLGVGEPDFETPWHVREEAIYSLERRKTVYSANAGMIDLRKEISKYLKRKFELSYDPKSQIIATVGASEGIDLALRAVIEPGDEVLVHEPCFVSYKPCILMAGGIPVTITTEGNFRLTKEKLLEKITDKTKVLMLSYPNNPTGAIMEQSDLEKIVEVLRERNIVVISDEIYAELTYTNENHISIASFPEMYEKTVVLNGFSKAYAMTGWRLGYAAGPSEIIAAMTKIHQYIIMCAPTTAQYAGIEALKNGDTSVDDMRKSYDARRRMMVHGFREMGLECFEPLGAFYVFPCISSVGLDTNEFCERLLKESKVAVVPGTAFGACGEGYVRCSYACSIDSLKEALDRINNFIKHNR